VKAVIADVLDLVDQVVDVIVPANVDSVCVLSFEVFLFTEEQAVRLRLGVNCGVTLILV